MQQLEEYIDSQKTYLLLSMRDIAQTFNLSSRHLYKDFCGIFYSGNLHLLKKPKIAIIGTRTPNQYSKQYTAILSAQLSQSGFVIVSGGAIGIDTIAHLNSESNSILVSPVGLHQVYPRQNKALFKQIQTYGLLLSEYPDNASPRAYHFLERNRIIVALSDIVIIPQADLQSGSSSSARLCKALQKPLFVLPQRINESLGTQELLNQGDAKAIYNIESFVSTLSKTWNLTPQQKEQDGLLDFASNNGLFVEALQKFGNQVLEYELQGKIRRNGLYIELC